MEFFGAIGYSLIIINPPINKIINNLYSVTLGEYWDSERKLVDEEYKNIYFPFNNITTQEDFYITAEWTINHLEGTSEFLVGCTKFYYY